MEGRSKSLCLIGGGGLEQATRLAIRSGVYLVRRRVQEPQGLAGEDASHLVFICSMYKLKR